jgi:hypothetical protein
MFRDSLVISYSIVQLLPLCTVRNQYMFMKANRKSRKNPSEQHRPRDISSNCTEAYCIKSPLSRHWCAKPIAPAFQHFVEFPPIWFLCLTLHDLCFRKFHRNLQRKRTSSCSAAEQTYPNTKSSNTLHQLFRETLVDIRDYFKLQAHR